MIKYSHRGNINGKILEKENSIEYIKKSIELGYNCEVDVRYINNTLFLGHDFSQYIIDINELLKIKDKILIHCKSSETLNYFIKNYPEFEIFYHDIENCVLTSKNHIVCGPNTKENFTENTIIALPEDFINIPDYKNIYGIISDYVSVY